MAALEMIDLSMPIGPHFRWATDMEVAGDIGAGDDFRVTRLRTTCHGFTHVDARAHFVADAPTIEHTPLGQVVGPCRVLNLRGTAPNTPIDAAQLKSAHPGGPDGEILLLSVGWNARAYRGEDTRLLDKALARTMLTPQNGGPYGLGAALAGPGSSLVLMKRGQNVGYQGYMLMFPETGQNMVVMTGSDNGATSATALLRRAATISHWPPLGLLLD